MKYVIDVPDDGQCQYKYNEDTKELKFPCPRIDPNSFMGLDIVLTGVIPYTEPDEDKIKQKVEDEVWDLVRIITDMTDVQRKECFGGETCNLDEYLTYQEAKAKYEAWKRTKEIHVGDEVIPLDTQYDTMVVTKLWTSEFCDEWVDTIASDGKFYSFLKTSINKTGRHFSEVAELLKKMRGEE